MTRTFNKARNNCPFKGKSAYACDVKHFLHAFITEYAACSSTLKPASVV